MKRFETLEQDDLNYYRRLEIRDRLIDAILSKYESLAAASKAYGKNPAYLGNYNTLYRINSIYDFCRLANISLEYILTGNNKKCFSEVNITYKNILNEYYKKRIPRNHSAMKMAVFKIKHSDKLNFGINTLLTLSDHFKKDIYYLIQG
jgi:hypothetical protein